jgi:hypothetical protein
VLQTKQRGGLSRCRIENGVLQGDLDEEVDLADQSLQFEQERA